MDELTTKERETRKLRDEYMQLSNRRHMWLNEGRNRFNDFVLVALLYGTSSTIDGRSAHVLTETKGWTLLYTTEIVKFDVVKNDWEVRQSILISVGNVVLHGDPSMLRNNVVARMNDSGIIGESDVYLPDRIPENITEMIDLAKTKLVEQEYQKIVHDLRRLRELMLEI